MMAGNPNNWWSMHAHGHHHDQPPPNFLSQTPPLFPLEDYVHGSSSPLPTNFHLLPPGHGQDFPHSWSQLLMGGALSSVQERRFCQNHFPSRKLDTWDPHHHTDLNNSSGHHDTVGSADRVKEENNQCSNSYRHEDHEVFSAAQASAWQSLDFSNTCKGTQRSQHADHSSECNSTATGGVAYKKRARVQPSSTPPLKVRKEKLGDRITTLHQLVSPFGKTDTASVLLEAIGYIRFLQGQIEALSSPYNLGNAASGKSTQHSEYSVMGDEAAAKELSLRSRGLCLVPISHACTQVVPSHDNINIGAAASDYWAAAAPSSSFN
ncbi:hypothetical protein Dimus_004306 [Dionaea muscipula]